MTKRLNIYASQQQRSAPAASDSTAANSAPDHVRRLWSSKRARYTPGALLRGYVVAVYAPESTTAARSPKKVGIADRYSSYLCDVQIIEGGYASILPRVPILTTAFGAVDRIQYVPRAATIDLERGNAIALEGSPGKPATPIHDTDADLVVVAFLDNDAHKPVIVGALPSYSTLVPVTGSDHPKWEALVRGNRIAIEDNGRIVVDATGQTTGVVREDGTEEPAASPEVQIETTGATITANDSGVDIALKPDQKMTINGSSVTGTSQALVKQGGFDDLFGSAGAFWAEALPILTAVGSVLGLPTTRLATLLGTFASGKSTSGASLYSESLESE